MTTDETLYPMRHQIVFRQYNPNKPHKYDFLSKSLKNASFPYTYKPVPYAAKPSAENDLYYITATFDYVYYLITETKRQVNLEGRNISTDRPYTRIKAANWMLE